MCKVTFAVSGVYVITSISSVIHDPLSVLYLKTNSIISALKLVGKYADKQDKITMFIDEEEAESLSMYGVGSYNSNKTEFLDYCFRTNKVASIKDTSLYSDEVKESIYKPKNSKVNKLVVKFNKSSLNLNLDSVLDLTIDYEDYRTVSNYCKLIDPAEVHILSNRGKFSSDKRDHLDTLLLWCYDKKSRTFHNKKLILDY